MINREICDGDIIEIWRQGLKKSVGDLNGFAQYKQPSGVIRLVYKLKERVDLAVYISDPFFNYSKSILGITTIYYPHFLAITIRKTFRRYFDLFVQSSQPSYNRTCNCWI